MATVERMIKWTHEISLISHAVTLPKGWDSALAATTMTSIAANAALEIQKLPHNSMLEIECCVLGTPKRLDLGEENEIVRVGAPIRLPCESREPNAHEWYLLCAQIKEDI